MKTVRSKVSRKHVSTATPVDEGGVSAKLAQSVLDLVSTIPPTHERAVSGDANADRIDAVMRNARRKAAIASSTLALPPGPLGWLTVLPEIYAVWKIQAQMVSDLAALHGRKAQLSREQMLYCLFRHTGAQLFRDLVMRVGERYLVRRLPIRSLYAVANKIGMRLTQRSIGRAISRIVPIAGALGVGAYSWYDTRQVARTALELFSREVTVEAARTVTPRSRPGSSEKKPTAKRARRKVAV
jgi:hypothetical protein